MPPSRCKSPSNGAAASWARAGPEIDSEMRIRAARNCFDMNGSGDGRGMPFQGAGSKARRSLRISTRSGPEQATRRLDDLRQAAGQLEVTERVGFKPFEIVELVVQDHLAGYPARRERHDQIM